MNTTENEYRKQVSILADALKESLQATARDTKIGINIFSKQGWLKKDAYSREVARKSSTFDM